MLRKYLFYPFLPKVYVLDFLKGRRYLGRVWRVTPDKIIIIKLFKGEIEVNFTNFVTDEDGYIILAKDCGDKIIPYFSSEQFNNFRETLDYVGVMREVIFSEVRKIKDMMEKVRNIISNTSEIFEEKTVEVVKALNKSYIDAITLIQNVISPKMEEEKTIKELQPIKENVEEETEEEEEEEEEE